MTDTFFPKIAPSWDNVEEYGGARQATDKNTAHALWCRITKATDTLLIFNTYRFSTATMVKRKLLNVALCVHCVSCFSLLEGLTHPCLRPLVLRLFSLKPFIPLLSLRPLLLTRLRRFICVFLIVITFLFTPTFSETKLECKTRPCFNKNDNMTSRCAVTSHNETAANFTVIRWSWCEVTVKWHTK